MRSSMRRRARSQTGTAGPWLQRPLFPRARRSTLHGHDQDRTDHRRQPRHRPQHRPAPRRRRHRHLPLARRRGATPSSPKLEALGRKAAALQLDVADTSGFPAFAGELRRPSEAGAATASTSSSTTPARTARRRSPSSPRRTSTTSWTSTSRASSSSPRRSSRCSPTAARSSTSRPASRSTSAPTAPSTRPSRAPSRSSPATSRSSSASAASPSTPSLPGAVATDFSGGVLRATPALQEADRGRHGTGPDRRGRRHRPGDRGPARRWPPLDQR